MQIDATHSSLRDIPVDSIDRNKDNPRLVFRPAELETLQESISRYGVQVPISVFKNGSRFVLIDGERRWRCSIKLNRKTIPALVQDEPDDLTNLLLMFNIHALREQWDLLTIAAKLPKTIDLLRTKLGTSPTEAQIVEETGLTRGLIRRCKLLIDLPKRYREDLLEELQKPKGKQKLTEDLFIEMERALKTVERAMPETLDDKDTVRDVLIEKYKSNVIKDITDFRYLPKIAKAESVAADDREATKALRRVFRSNNYSIEEAYRDTVSGAYSEKELISRISQLSERLDGITPENVDTELADALRDLARRISRLLRHG